MSGGVSGGGHGGGCSPIAGGARLESYPSDGEDSRGASGQAPLVALVGSALQWAPCELCGFGTVSQPPWASVASFIKAPWGMSFLWVGLGLQSA